MGKQWKQWQTIFLGSKITADGDCSHEIKWCLLLGRKAMTNLDSILKSKDIILPTKVRLVKAMVFPVVMHGCERWAIKTAEHWRSDVFNCSIGDSALASVLPMNIQSWFPLGWTGLIPCSPRDSQEFSPTPQFKSINSLVLNFLYCPILTSIHDYWEKIALTRQTFVNKVMSLLFNVLSSLVITFLPRSKHLLISWL